jgi:hypothetical protein
VWVVQAAVTRDPAPDEQLPAITGAPQLPTDVPARQPDMPVADRAKQGWSRRSDDPDVLERHEIIGVVHDHGTILLPESAPSTRG